MDHFWAALNFEQIAVFHYEGLCFNFHPLSCKLWVETLSEIRESLWVVCELAVSVLG